MTYLWQMTLLGGICTLLLLAAKPLVLKKGGGKWYCGLWILVLLAYLLPYKLVFFIHLVPVENTTISTIAVSDLPTVQTDMEGAVFPVETNISVGGISFAEIRTAIYGIGLLVFLLYYLVSYIFLRRRIHRQADEMDCHILHEVQRELGIRRKIALKVDQCIQTPLFWGMLKPTILLPQKSYDKEELYFLLCHELTHYKSCHMYLRFLALLVHVIHWFNPLSYVALRQIQEACEYACDEGVTEKMSREKRLAYGYLLVRGVCSGKTSVFSLGFGGNRGKDVLKRRLEVIMEEQKKKKVQKVGIAVLAVGTLTVCGSFFDLKPIYAGASTQVEYTLAEKPQVFLWTDHVQTEDEAISLAKEYVEKVFSGEVKSLSVTAEYHDAKEQQPEGWLIRFVSPKKTEETKEFSVWLTKKENTMVVRRSTFAKQTKEVLSEEEWKKLLEDAFWVTEGKKFAENSPWQKEEVTDINVTAKEGQRKQEEVCVSVDTASGAKYMLYFHPWKELGEVQYCPPALVEYRPSAQANGILWTDKVNTKEDAVLFAKEYVEKVLHENTEKRIATVEYHDGKDNSVHPEGWFVQLSPGEQKENEREYAIWLEKAGNQIAVRQRSLKNKSPKMAGGTGENAHKQAEEGKDALLQDKFWTAEAKKIVKDSNLQKEKITDAIVVPYQKDYVSVEVDTESGAKYLVSFHPWKELSSVKYCPPTKQDIHQQHMENQVAEKIDKMPNVTRVETENIPSGFPVQGKVSKAFDGKKHLGIDIDTHKRALPILATADGTVAEAKFDQRLGHYVVIDHGNGFVTKYAHNAKNLVKAGDTVEKGKEIALTGKTGMATGVHCHYEVWKNGVSQNPNDFR